MKTQLALFGILLVSTFFSCDTQHILLDNHEGYVVDKTTNQTIPNVRVYTDSTAYDYFQPYITEEDGYFFASGMFLPHYDKGYFWRRKMSYTLIFSSEGYKTDTIRLGGDDNQIFDTVNLGNIYLTPIQD